MACFAGPLPEPVILVRTREIPCGFETSAGVDTDRDGILSLDERITIVIICDKDKGKLQPPIIRTQGK